jgi:calcineurin-like phosphoesterase family protein
MIWFTSDTHFLHAGIIDHCERPFFDVNHQTEELISRWNNYVKPGDTIYHLGDFAITYGRRDLDKVDAILSRLNGQKWLINGNHDRDEVKNNPRWHKVCDYHELKVDLGGVHKQRIVLFHYALRVWNQNHHGAWMLHGHSHGNLESCGGKTFDVGVDCFEYAPISIENVSHLMKSKEFLPMDHHT